MPPIFSGKKLTIIQYGENQPRKPQAPVLQRVWKILSKKKKAG